MRFEHIKARDFGSLREVDIDLGAIPGVLVAVTGDNGAGKSTLLELLVGALYRDTPTRGTLADLATSRQSFVEVRAESGGSTYTVRQNVDAISGKGESLIVNGAGNPLTGSKVREADAWVREHFPRAELVYTSMFLAQRSDGFLDFDPAERKAVLLQLLEGGIARLEGYALAAREHAREGRGSVETARARLADAKKRASPVAEAEMSAREWTERLGACVLTMVGARTELQEAQAHRADADRAAEIRKQRAGLIKAHQELLLQIQDVAARITNNQGLLKREDEITAAVAELGWLEQEHANARTELARATEARNSRATERLRADATAAQAHQAAGRLDENLRTAQARARDVTKVERAVAALPAAKERHAKAVKAVRELSEQIEAAESALGVGSAGRIKDLRHGLITIRDGSRAPRQLAKQVIEDDNVAEREGRAAPVAAKKLRAQLVLAERAMDEAVEQVQALREDAARAKDVAGAKADAERLAAEKKTHAKAVVVADKAVEAAAVASKNAAGEVQQADRLVKRLEQRRPQLLEWTAHAPQLATARARVEELQPQLDQLTVQVAERASEIDALPEPNAIAVDFKAIEAKLAEAEGMVNHARAQQAIAAERVTQAQASAAECDALTMELRAAERVHEDWTRLAQDCGREGIQALEIDAALPQLNVLANDLLHACFGSRFTVELRSTRDSADGKRELEALTVHVIDTHSGFAGLAERYSGGERVILGEAIALALSMLACSVAGLSRPTLVRDESGSWLSPGNARSYVTMLRRAAQLVGADKVFVVSHDPALQALGDARIEVADGTAKVVLA